MKKKYILILLILVGFHFISFEIFPAEEPGTVAEEVLGKEESIGDIKEKIEKAEAEKLDIVKTLAAIYQINENIDKAIQYYQLAFNLSKDDKAISDKLLDLYNQKKMWREMIPIYEYLAESNPRKNQYYLKQLGDCYFKINQDDRAIEVFKKYLDEYSEYEETYYSIGDILFQHKKFEEAAKVYQKAIEGGFSDKYKVHWSLAKIYMQLEKYDRALKAYESAKKYVSKGYDRQQIEAELIQLYKKTDIIDKVIKEKENEIKEIDKKLIDLYWQEAREKEDGNEIESALKYYRKIVTIAPDSEKGKAAAKKIEELKK